MKENLIAVLQVLPIMGSHRGQWHTLGCVTNEAIIHSPEYWGRTVTVGGKKYAARWLSLQRMPEYLSPVSVLNYKPLRLKPFDGPAALFDDDCFNKVCLVLAELDGWKFRSVYPTRLGLPKTASLQTRENTIVND